LRLLFDTNYVGEIPEEGKNLLIVAIIDNIHHYRVFDGRGRLSEDTDDSRLAEQRCKIEDLSKVFESVRPPNALTKKKKRRLIRAAASILGYSVPRHWIVRVIGRMAIVAAALLYVLVVFLAQYTSWGGASSLYQQHAFLLPVPFPNM
jgi:hypothetical protein